MFSGIVEDVGVVTNLRHKSMDIEITVAVNKFDLRKNILGDSVAVDGMCLTMTDINLKDNSFNADISSLSLQTTIAKKYYNGCRVNLESALTLNKGINGHLVSGHVDGLAKIIQKYPTFNSICFELEIPEKYNKYITNKGSITLNGISLTINKVREYVIEINLIPHTYVNTNLDSYNIGTYVNFEVDLIARYLEKLLPSNI